MATTGNSIDKLHRLYQKGASSPVDAVEDFLSQAKQKEGWLNAFINVLGERARATAQELGELPEHPSPVWGVPFAVKDNLCVAGVETTCASRMLLGYKPPYTATPVQRLLDAGAILVAKTNMDEFAMGSTGEYSYFGPTSNPIDPDYVPGGSSSGSAAAVGAGLVPFALGTDTGGSVRQPAAWSGVVGFKPSYGRISRFGLIAFASSLDQVAVVSAAVQDAARAFWIMAGFDPKDSTTSQEPLPGLDDMLTPLSREEIKGLTIGIPKEYFGQGVQTEIANGVMAAAEELASQGAKLVELSMPHTRFAVAAYQIIVAAECSANLARFDGVRYGFRAKEFDDLDQMYIRTRSQGFGPEVKRRIAVGAFVLSAQQNAQHFVSAQKVRRLVSRDYQKAFEQVDLLLSPTVSMPPVKKGEKTQDPIAIYAMDALTSATNLAGLPGLTLPLRSKDSLGFPVGLHLTGRFMDELTVLRTALTIQQMQ